MANSSYDAVLTKKKTTKATVVTPQYSESHVNDTVIASHVAKLNFSLVFINNSAGEMLGIQWRQYAFKVDTGGAGFIELMDKMAKLKLLLVMQNSKVLVNKYTTKLTEKAVDIYNKIFKLGLPLKVMSRDREQ